VNAEKLLPLYYKWEGKELGQETVMSTSWKPNLKSFKHLPFLDQTLSVPSNIFQIYTLHLCFGGENQNT